MQFSILAIPQQTETTVQTYSKKKEKTQLNRTEFTYYTIRDIGEECEER